MCLCYILLVDSKNNSINYVQPATIQKSSGMKSLRRGYIVFGLIVIAMLYYQFLFPTLPYLSQSSDFHQNRHQQHALMWLLIPLYFTAVYLFVILGRKKKSDGFNRMWLGNVLMYILCMLITFSPIFYFLYFAFFFRMDGLV